MIRTFTQHALAALFLLTISMGAFAQPGITLRSQMYVQDSSATDIWGYYDSIADREYAIVGSWNAVSIIDVTDPDNPSYEAFIDTIRGFDVKVWDHYVYAVGGNSNGTGRVIDVANPSQPQVVGSFWDAHNIFIDDKGYLIASFPGLKIYDLNTTPENPQLIWEDTTSAGHDAFILNDTLYYFEGYNGIWIMDAANRSQPQLVQVILDPLVQYAHSGWLTSDHSHLIVCDELATHPIPDITVWDIRNLANITKVDDFGDSTAIVHNTFVIGDYAYTSYYMNGFRIFDVSDPTNIHIEWEYATYPDSSSEHFGGAFGVYPYAPSGNVYVSDMKYGLFVFSVDTVQTSTAPGAMSGDFGIHSLGPNPAGELSVLHFETVGKSNIGIQLFDAGGRLVRDYGESSWAAGVHRFEIHRGELASGLYTLRLQNGETVLSRKLFFMR